MLARTGRRILSLSGRTSDCKQMRKLTTATEQYIIKSPIPDIIPPPKGNFINYVFKDINKWRNKEALRCSVTGNNYTYDELYQKISKFASLLTKLGVTKGDVVAIHAINSPDYAIAYYGTMFVGAIVSPISTTYTPGEILNQLRDCRATIVVGHPLLELQLIKALESYGQNRHLLMYGPSRSTAAINLLQAIDDPNIGFTNPVQLTGDEPAVIPYSSGTTGAPKGVVQTHDAFSNFFNGITHPHIFSALSGEYQDQFMALLPFYHTYGMNIMNCALFNGMRVVTVPKFDPKTFVKTVADHKLEHLHIVPPILAFLVNSPTATSKALASLKSIVIAAAPVAPTLAHAIKDKLDKDIFFQEAYGMTEVFVTHQTPVAGEKLGTSGQVIPNCRAKIIDSDTGEALPPNTKGEILLKTPSMMKGYHNNEVATAETIDKDGWLHTGDIGMYDEEGYFKIVDRTKELIKVKGMQVSPSELEDVIRRHPKVVDIGVTGVPHERLGEAPRAFVVCKEPLKPEELHQYMETRLASHKQLAGGITIVESLPKSATGKLLRKDLQRMA
ncbi:unnamed protein product, partial [Meganyctiphanes norvegica]